MSRRLLVAIAGIALLLGACATKPSSVSAPTSAVSSPAQTIPAGIDPFAGGSNTLTRLDEQGAILVEVTPANLEAVIDRLEFDVALNTHSIDLSMDLAPLSTLTTDTGLDVAAELWEAPRGGHHTRGTLVFALSQDALSLLAGAGSLTLTVVDLDAAARVFEWELQ